MTKFVIIERTVFNTAYIKQVMPYSSADAPDARSAIMLDDGELKSSTLSVDEVLAILNK